MVCRMSLEMEGRILRWTCRVVTGKPPVRTSLSNREMSRLYLCRDSACHTMRNLCITTFSRSAGTCMHAILHVLQKCKRVIACLEHVQQEGEQE